MGKKGHTMVQSCEFKNSKNVGKKGKTIDKILPMHSTVHHIQEHTLLEGKKGLSNYS